MNDQQNSVALTRPGAGEGTQIAPRTPVDNAFRQMMRANPLGLIGDDNAWRYAERISKAALVPKDLRNSTADVLLLLQFGLELGLSIGQIFRSCYVVNGKCSIYGEMVLTLFRQHPKFEAFNREWSDQTQTWTVTGKLQGEPAIAATFSYADAQYARLITLENGKPKGGNGVWASYPRDMCYYKALARMVKACAPEVLGGFVVHEDVIDMEPDAQGGYSPAGGDAQVQPRRADSLAQRTGAINHLPGVGAAGTSSGAVEQQNPLERRIYAAKPSEMEPLAREIGALPSDAAQTAWVLWLERIMKACGQDALKATTKETLRGYVRANLQTILETAGQPAVALIERIGGIELPRPVQAEPTTTTTEAASEAGDDEQEDNDQPDATQASMFSDAPTTTTQQGPAMTQPAVALIERARTSTTLDEVRAIQSDMGNAGLRQGERLAVSQAIADAKVRISGS